MNTANRRGLIFILIGVIAAIAAGFVVFALAMNIGRVAQQNNTVASPVTTQVPGKEVIVAASDIDANSVITTSMLLTTTYPSDLVPPDAYTNTLEIIGTTAKQRILGGLPLLKRQFIAASGRQGPSVVIPKGKVLVAFPSTDILNSTGAVQPGDHVDILLTLPISGTARLDASASSGSQVQANAKAIVSQATLQNIEVYNTGQFTPPSTGGGSDQNVNRNLKIVTFIVEHQEALILKYVKDSGGTIDLVVRSLEDNQQVATDPVSLDYLVDLYRFIGLPKQTP